LAFRVKGLIKRATTRVLISWQVIKVSKMTVANYISVIRYKALLFYANFIGILNSKSNIVGCCAALRHAGNASIRVLMGAVASAALRHAEDVSVQALMGVVGSAALL
jgi:hypothetical protein